MLLFLFNLAMTWGIFLPWGSNSLQWERGLNHWTIREVQNMLNEWIPWLKEANAHISYYLLFRTEYFRDTFFASVLSYQSFWWIVIQNHLIQLIAYVSDSILGLVQCMTPKNFIFFKNLLMLFKQLMLSLSFQLYFISSNFIFSIITVPKY